MILSVDSSAPFRFSTDEVQPERRTAVWREVLGRVHLHLDVEQIGDGPLHATVESHRWGSSSLYFSHTTPVRATRTREFVQDGDGDFRLLRADGAAYRYVANGVDEIVADGRSALLFNGVAGSVSYLGPCHVTAIRVRRADLASAVRGLDERALRHVVDASALRLLHGYTEVLRRQGPTDDPLLAARVANHLTDLVATALGATGDAAELARGRGVRAARLEAVKRDILSHIASPDLSIDAVAARNGITPRYLRMLLQDEETSFTAFVLEQRLARAHRMIRESRGFDRISTAAFAAGFGDLSYFNRAFRRRFGMTPSDLRAVVLEECRSAAFEPLLAASRSPTRADRR
jgi:AraC-like DNA-binding protein